MLPIRRDLGLAYWTSLLVAVLMCAVSVAGLLLGADALSGADPSAALGVTASTAGVLVPGLQAHDLLNLVLGLPVLLVVVLLARRGSLVGLLLWPGALFYALYTYTQYLLGAPFGALFLAYVALVVLSAYTVIGVVASVDGERTRRQFDRAVSARIVAGILVVLGLLTLVQDAGGALSTALAGATLNPVARAVWTADLTLVVPAMLLGGILLWRRQALGFVVAPGLLLQFGLTPIVLAAILALQPYLTGSPVDVATIVGLLVFAVVALAPLPFILRGAARNRPAEPSTAAAAATGYASGQGLRR